MFLENSWICFGFVLDLFGFCFDFFGFFDFFFVFLIVFKIFWDFVFFSISIRFFGFQLDFFNERWRSDKPEKTNKQKTKKKQNQIHFVIFYFHWFNSKI